MTKESGFENMLKFIIERAKEPPKRTKIMSEVIRQMYQAYAAQMSNPDNVRKR